MFGTINQTKTEEKKQNDETCYGGFQSRFDYELCCLERRSGRALRAVRILITTGMCMLFGMIGIFAGIMVFEIVDNHQALYYPRGSMPGQIADVSSSADASASIHAEVHPDGLSAAAGKVPAMGAENVTPELSRRYRIPVGVMLRTVDPASSAASAGLEDGDIIVAVSGVEISDAAVLERLVNEAVGAVEMTVFRDNRYFSVTLKK